MNASKHASLRTFLLAALMLAGGGCDFGDPVDHSTGGGTSVDGLTGNLVVTDGSPAAGAMVRVFSASGSSGTLAKSAGASEASWALDSVQANSTGRFQFKDLPDGTYNLTATLRLADNTVLALYLPGIVVDGKTSIGVDTLQLTGTLVLQVRGPGNAKIPGALCAIAGGAWQISSDTTGTCTLTEVPPGTFRAIITHPSYLTAISADVVVTSGISTSGGVVILTGTTNPLPPGPVLTSPAANATGVSITGPLSWTPPNVQNPMGYRVQLATDSGFLQIARDTFVANPGVGFANAPLAHGTVYFWRANATIGAGISTPVGGTTAWSAFRKFTTADGVPAAPVPLYPLSGAVNLPAIPGYIWSPAFTWSSVSGATAYHLEVVGSDNLAVPLANDSTLTDTSRVAGPLKELVTYGWRVKARNAAGWGPWSATITVTRGGTSTPTLAAPQLATPAANAIGVALGSQLTWNAVEGATSYRVQISTSPIFSTFALNDTNVTTSRGAAPLDFSTTYYWRVQARNASGTSDWSETRSFTTQPFVDAVLLPAPVLSGPVNGAVNVASTPTLSWQSSSGAMTYHVQLSTSAAFTTLLVNDSTLTTTSHNVGPLTASTLYYWRVRALSPGGSSAYSSIHIFNTAAAAAPPRDTALVAWQDASIVGFMPSIVLGSNRNRNAGKQPGLSVGAFDMNTVWRSLMQFELPPDVTGTKISKAVLRFYLHQWSHTDPGISHRIDAHKLLRSWKEGNATGTDNWNSASIDGVTAVERFWGTQDGSEDWNQMLIGLDGVDAEATAAASGSKSGSYIGYWDFDITSLAKNWADNPAQNFGVVLLRPDIPDDPRYTDPHPIFHSRDAAVADSLKPRLLLTISP